MQFDINLRRLSYKEQIELINKINHFLYSQQSPTNNMFQLETKESGIHLFQCDNDSFRCIKENFEIYTDRHLLYTPVYQKIKKMWYDNLANTKKSKLINFDEMSYKELAAIGRTFISDQLLLNFWYRITESEYYDKKKYITNPPSHNIREDIPVGWLICVSDEDTIQKHLENGRDVEIPHILKNINESIRDFERESKYILKALGATHSIDEGHNQWSQLVGTAWFSRDTLLNIVKYAKDSDSYNRTVSYYSGTLPNNIRIYDRILHSAVDFEELTLFDISEELFDEAEG